MLKYGPEVTSMKRNVGTLDRAIRLAVAIVIAALYYAGRIDGTLAIVLGIVALVFVLTSLIGMCPAYLTLGLSTCKEEGKP
jgi:Inner membrane protein YgaP-like, transmembrane domain